MCFHQEPASFIFCFWIGSLLFPLMVHLVETPSALKLDHDNSKKKKKGKKFLKKIKKSSFVHIFLKFYFFNPLQLSKYVHTPSHITLYSLRSSLLLEVRHIPNLTCGEVPGGIRVCRKCLSPKYSLPAVSPPELKRKPRHKVIRTFYSTGITISMYKWS